jgi:glutamyl-tRNA synthetase
MLSIKIAGSSDYNRSSLEELYRGLAGERGLSAGALIHPTRLAMSGVSFGPGLFEMMELLGRETVLRRLRKAVEWIGENETRQ